MLRKVGRGLLWALALVVGGVALVVLSALALLQVGAVRSAAVSSLLELANGQLAPLRIELDRVDRLDPWGLSIVGLSLYDSRSDPFLRAARVDASISPAELFGSTLRLRDAAIDGASFRLPEFPPSEEPEQETDSSFVVQVDRLALTHGRAELVSEDHTVSVKLPVVVATGSLGPSPRLALVRAEVEASLDGETVATLSTRQSSFSFETGGQSTITGEVLGARLRLFARFLGARDVADLPVSELRVSLRDLRPEALAGLSLTADVALGRPLSLEANLRARGQATTAALSLQSGPDTITLSAEKHKSRYRAELSVSPTQLRAWSALLPDLSARGKLALSLDDKGDAQTAQLSWQNAQVAKQSIPDGEADLTIARPKLVLNQLRLQGFERALELDGSFDLDSGNFEATADLAGLALSKLLGADYSGRLSGGISLSRSGKALRGKAQLTGRLLAASGVQARAAELDLDLNGTVDSPTARLRLSLTELRRSNLSLSEAMLEGAVSARDLEGTLLLRSHDIRTRVSLLGTRGPGGDLHLQVRGTRAFPQTSLRLALLDATYGASGDLRLNWLELADGEGRLYAKGSLSNEGQLDFSLTVERLSLEPWLALAGVPHGRGRVDLTSRATGTVQKPALLLDCDLSDVQLGDGPILSAGVHFDADIPKRRLAARLRLQDRRGAVEAKAAIAASLPRRRSLERQLLAADYRLSAELASDLSWAVEQLSGGALPIAGRARLRIQGQGTPNAPELKGQLDASVKPAGESQAPSERVGVEWTLQPTGKFGVEAEVRDLRGQLLGLSAEAQLPAWGVDDVPQLEALLRSPVAVTATVTPRVAGVQGAVGSLAALYGVRLPDRASGKLEAQSDGQTIEGTLRAQAELDLGALSPGCQEPGRVATTVSAELAEGRLAARLSLRPTQGGSVDAELAGPLQVAPVLEDAVAMLGPFSSRVTAKQLPLRAIPGLCGRQDGYVDAELHGRNIMAGPIESDISLEVSRLSAFREAPQSGKQLAVTGPDRARLKLRVDAQTRGNELTAHGQIQTEDKPRGALRARIPLRYTGPFFEIDDQAELSVKLDLSELPIGPLVALTEQVGQGGGAVSAQLQLDGSLARPRPRGRVRFFDVGFSVASIAQPVSGLNGAVVLSDRELRIERIMLADRDGSIKLAGTYRIASGLSGQGRLEIETDQFPLRQQGSVIGALSIGASLDAQVDSESNLDLDLTLKEGRIWLTGNGGNEVQALEAHPDVRFFGDPAKPVVRVASEGGLTLRSFEIRSERRLWVMHEDFSVQVATDLAIERRDGLVITGDVTLHRGTLNLLGKNFRIERGAIRFTGDMPPNPELNIRAVFEPRSGADLIVRVSGRSHAPEVSFSGAATTAGEAALVLSGLNAPEADKQAKHDAAALATGITAGLLSVTARREFGEWVPVITLQQDAGGLSGATAGFDASDLIPKPLEGFARGVYIEGMVGRRGDRQSQGLGVGVKVEVALPRDFVTSMGYGPGTTWSTDVYWSP